MAFSLETAAHFGEGTVDADGGVVPKTRLRAYEEGPSVIEQIVERSDVAELLEPLATHVPVKYAHSLRTGSIALDAHRELGSPTDVQTRALEAGLKHDAFQVVSFEPVRQTLVVSQRKIQAITSTGPRLPIITAHPVEASAYVRYMQRSPEVADVIFYHHTMQGPEFSYPYELDSNLLSPEQVFEYALFAAADTTDSLLNIRLRPYPSWEKTSWEKGGTERLAQGEWTSNRIRDELEAKFGRYLGSRQRNAVLEAGEKYRGMTAERLFAVAA